MRVPREQAMPDTAVTTPGQRSLSGRSSEKRSHADLSLTSFNTVLLVNAFPMRYLVSWSDIQERSWPRPLKDPCRIPSTPRLGSLPRH